MSTAGGRKPRMVLLMQFYDPEPVYKGQDFAEAVARAGYEVEVVTGFPNYPGGKVYDGYRMRLIARKQVNDVTVTRIPLYPSHGSSKVGRILNYVSFFLTASFYLTILAKRPVGFYAYHPPVTVGLAAAVAGWVRRVPVVVDIHDLWPDTLPATGMISNPRILRTIDVACNWLYRQARTIILHSHGFRERLLQRGVPESKTVTVVGWTNESNQDESTPETPTPMASLRGMTLLFAGNMGPAQALGSIIDAARLLQDEGHTARVTFCFLGSGLELSRLKSAATEIGLQNVVFIPRVTSSEVGAYLRSADSLLVHLRDDPLFSITLPSKTQAYMLAGRPILMAVRGEAADLIAHSRSGVTATPEDPRSIADAALALADLAPNERDRMGQAGRDYYWSELSMEKGMAKVIAVFRALEKREP